MAQDIGVVGSNPASPTDNQDRFSDPDFFILSRLLREVLRSIDGNNSHSFLRQEQLEHSDEP